ncbi:unnamed protein product [Closterium sp. NIES-53]
MHVGGEARIGQPRVVDRCKLAVSLVKMLFKPPGDCPPTLLPGLPPFTAGAFEAHVNQQARHLPADFGLLRSCEMSAQVAWRRLPVKTCPGLIRDTNTGKTYKLICVPHPDGAGIILTKVKCNSTRYAVIDVARPTKAVDLRVFFRKESRLCSLDGAIQAAFERIASTAVIDSISGSWVIAGDRLTWKLNEMNVRMLYQPEGFVTSISVFPTCWGEMMKCYEKPEPAPTNSLQAIKSTSSAYYAAACFDSTLQQAPPKWTPDSILSEFPALIDWLQQRLP